MIRVRAAAVKSTNIAAAEIKETWNMMGWMYCSTLFLLNEPFPQDFLHVIERRRKMAGFCMVAGGIFLLYYIASVIYAGVGASYIWIWLLGGILLLALGGGLRYCSLHQIPVHIPVGIKIVLLIGIAAVLALFLFVEGLIFSGMRQKGEQNLDYIIVLGCRVKGDRPTRALQERIDTAYEYLMKNPRTRAILSGGQGMDEDISEAECMKKGLLQAGIGEDRLIEENRSTSTEENLENSKEYLDAQKDRIGIVTSNFHVYRGVALAKNKGYHNVCGIAAPSGTILQPHYLVREFLAVLMEKMRGNI